MLMNVVLLLINQLVECVIRCHMHSINHFEVVLMSRLFGVSHTGSEANRRYPDQLNLPSHYKCVIEKDGGILCANKAVAALQVRKDQVFS